MFKPDLNKELKLERNPSRVKAFLSDELEYYTKLYELMLTFADTNKAGYESIYYNGLNEMDSQYLLALSACSVNDPEEDKKIKLVSYHVDRLFSLLRLQRSYDSNEFSDAVFEISAAIRGKPASEIGPAFEKKLIALLSERRGTEVTSAFDYG